jgi:shikimate kinase
MAGEPTGNPPPRPGAFHRVVLIGLPGAGKSTVAPILARRLGWLCVDLDHEIMQRTGRTVTELFQSDGESAFRAMELRLTVELSSLPERVLAPGGGWAAQPGALESLPVGTAVVWLRISPDEAMRRLRGSSVERPLLSGPDPLANLRALARQRTERYARADLAVDVDGLSAAETAEIITEWLRRST